MFLFIFFFIFSFSKADLQFSNKYPKPGETVYFNGTLCFTKDYRLIVKEPSGGYYEFPDYLNFTAKDIGDCPDRWQKEYRKFYVEGSIKIPENSPPGSYTLIIEYFISLSSYPIKYTLTVTQDLSEWKYKINEYQDWKIIKVPIKI